MGNMMNWYTEINVQNREIKTKANQRFKDFCISAGVKKVLQRFLLKLAVAPNGKLHTGAMWQLQVDSIVKCSYS